MKIQILILLLSITLSKASAQSDYSVSMDKSRSASNIAIQNSDYLKSPQWSKLENNVIFVNNHTFTIITDGLMPNDLKKSRYFYDDKFHLGELLLKDQRYFKPEYTYRFDLLTGNIELKDKSNEISKIRLSILCRLAQRIPINSNFCKLSISHPPLNYCVILIKI